MWLLAPWKKYIKALLTLPLIFTSVVFLLVSFSVVQGVTQTGGLLKNEEIKMEKFLEEKYGKDFVIKSGKIVNGGDVLFGVRFKTYKAEVSPVDDTNMVFTASRVVEGRALNVSEDSPAKLNYSDDYLLRVWTLELEDKVKSAVMNQPINAFDVDFRVGLARNKESIAKFYDNIWGKTPSYSQLPLELKQELSLMSHIKVTGSMTAERVEAYAAAMIAMRNVLDSNRQGLDVQVSHFEIYRSQEDDEKLGEWQNVGFVKLAKVESIDELTPYFIKWTDGKGKFYNPKTRAFDINHPN